jgi:hypothetical protein
LAFFSLHEEFRMVRSCRRSKWWSVVLGAGCSLLAWGCGLSDYETHMDEEQAYLKDFDDENKFLGGPLEMPPKMDSKTKMPTDALRVKFFLRPPQSTATKVPPNEVFSFQQVNLYRYPGGAGFNVLFTSGELDKNPLTQHEVHGGIAPKDFRSQVRGALAQFVKKQYGVNATSWLTEDSLETVNYPVRNLHGRPGNLTFERQGFRDTPPGAKEDPKHRSFELYYCIDGINQAAIVYEIPVQFSRDTDTRKKVDFSLKSLVLGPDAQNRLAGQTQRQQRTRSGPARVVNADDLK